MLLHLEDRHKQDLLQLTGYELEVIIQFCKVALEFIKRGEQNKIFSAASKKLGVEEDVIANLVMALAHLLAEASKHNLNETEFIDSLFVLQYEDGLVDVLKQAYLASKEEIRSILKDSSFDLPHYVDLDWRLDVQIGSRNLKDQVKPVFILKLDTEHEGRIDHHVLSTDYTNLKHMKEQLEEALEELKTPYSIRVGRNI